MPVAPLKKRPARPLAARIAALQALVRGLLPVPDAWLKTAAKASSKNNDGDGTDDGTMECLPCNSYRELIMSWRKAMRWTDGLDHALAVMLASVASTKAVGDQLWIKVIGPAACGKSTLCEAISVNHEYVLAKSTIRGFHSGYKLDSPEEGGGGGEQDHSLIPQIRGKTLVTKDGDTLLQSPNLSQILAEARDLYDSTSRTHYRNAMSKDYSGVRMTWLLCGTSSLRSIDSSELGERFLDCVIMDGIDDDLEDEILWRVANRADRNLALESGTDAASQHEPALAEAMQLTGGYVTFLRENASKALAGITLPDTGKHQCTRLGKFVAFMRARPSYHQEEVAERELAARLVSQHVRLAKCLAFVLNKNEVDAEVMRRVRQVALDTSRGQTLAIAAHLHGTGDIGLEPTSLAHLLTKEDSRVRTLLRFLKAIHVTEVYQPKVSKGVKGRPRYRLTSKLRKLFDEVFPQSTT